MTTTAATAGGTPAADEGMKKHPKGLYVLFFAEMWERFSFYSMLALFTLYLQNPEEGFGWTDARATTHYSLYIAFVYFTPLFGGIIADRWLGYRKTVMLGALFFMAGHLLLSFRSVPIMYSALACLIVGNGLFKPNVSAMVGALYPDDSPLKERAYNIFYLGINVGALIAPIVAEIVKREYGNHAAFAVAAFGMLLSVLTLAAFKKHIDHADDRRGKVTASKGELPIDRISDARRIGALIVVFVAVIVFWIVFHQNGSTLTYFAENNTSPLLPGTLSNAINSGYVLLLTFPLIWFWTALRKARKEPAIPTKMAVGMLLTGLSFLILYAASHAGAERVGFVDGKAIEGKVHPWWLFASYGVVTLGELMLSPMGLALVSKVAPSRHRGMMMGGWFVATGLGNLLTIVGVYWSKWSHAFFFAALGGTAIGMAVIMFGLNRWLKKSMPGV
jgi:POT family proton-dependent oligopeptide transporter